MYNRIRNLQKRGNELTRLEKEVLDFILESPRSVVDKTLDELSAEIFVSTATISRTAKRLGFKGYQELRYSLSQYIDNEKGAGQSTNNSYDIQEYAETIAKQIQQTAQNLLTSPIDEIVNRIIVSKQIEFFGVGGSLPNCINGARKLVFLGKKANARVDWDELRAISQSLTMDDLAILVSNSGETIHIIEYANNLLKNKVPILAIVSNPESTLEKIATYTLLAEEKLIYEEDIDLSARASLNFILDSLILKTAKQM